MHSNRSGRVEIGRQARLRIWCREAYGFDSLRPHTKREPSLVLFFRMGDMPALARYPIHIYLPSGKGLAFSAVPKTLRTSAMQTRFGEFRVNLGVQKTILTQIWQFRARGLRQCSDPLFHISTAHMQHDWPQPNKSNNLHKKSTAVHKNLCFHEQQ